MSTTKKTLAVLSTLLILLTLPGCQKRAHPSKSNVHSTTKSPTKKVLKKTQFPELYINAKNVKNTSTSRTNKNQSTLKFNNTKENTKVLILQNKGKAVLSIDSIVLTNNIAKAFDVKHNCGNELNASKTCKITLSFVSQSKGKYSANIIIKSDSHGKSVGKVKDIQLLGTAIDRQFGVIQHPKTVANQQKPMIKLTFNDFSKTQYAEIKNNGLDPIPLSNYTLFGENKDAFKYEHNCPDILDVGKTCKITFNYQADKEGINLAYLRVNSTGILSPSNVIRLIGHSSPKSSNGTSSFLPLRTMVTSFHVTENQKHFLEDISHVNQTYYYRVIYQAPMNSKFKEYYNEAITAHFEKSGYTLVKDPSKADKIINVYPSIILQKGGSETTVKAQIEAIVLTKTNHTEDIIVTNTDVNTTIQSKASKAVVLPLKFEVELSITGYADQFSVYSEAAEKINDFTFNLLGLSN